MLDFMNPSDTISRRRAIQLGLAGLAAVTAAPSLRVARASESASDPILRIEDETYPFRLPELPYGYDAMEPFIDAKTMEIHHKKHHAAYVNSLNAALEGHPDLHGRTLGELISQPDMLPEGIRTALRNHGGGHANHALFWLTMANPNTEPTPEFAAAIERDFGSRENLLEQLLDAGAKVFGSGWGWLAMNPEGQLTILPLPNQDSPWREGLVPLLGVDVWEHAYYLKYQNRRAEYLKAWTEIIDWKAVSRRAKGES